MQTYIWKNYQQQGPFDDQQIQQLLSTGGVNYADLAWREGMADWMPLSGLFLPPQATVTPPTIAAVAGTHQIFPSNEASLWNPNAAATWSLLCSPVFGATLVWLNYQTLGEKVKAKKALIWLAVGLALFVFGSHESGSGMAFTVMFVIGWFLFLIAWYFRCARPQASLVRERFGNSYRHKGWLTPLVIAGLLGGIAKFVLSPAPSADSIYGSHGQAALDAARTFMLGTWTYTGTKYQITDGSIWIKWVINPDGTILDYTAHASDDNWGKPEKGKWHVITGKYSDSGERYYGLQINDDVTEATIGRDGEVQYRLPDCTLTMERGDKRPFSK